MITIDGFVIDAATSEEHAFESEVTEHPVESGSDIADHVRARPIQVSIDGVVSDTPVGLTALLRGSLDTLPSSDALEKILGLRDARKVITVETSLRRYENMVLQSFSVPRSPETGDALVFRATFRQVRIVTNRRSTVRVAVPRAQRKQNLGSKAAGKPSDLDLPDEVLDADFQDRVRKRAGQIHIPPEEKEGVSLF